MLFNKKFKSLYLYSMDEKKFIFKSSSPINHRATWQAPSNIALVKYWGKHGDQLPKNPSISFTLSKCVTTTTVEFTPRLSENGSWFSFLFENKEQLDFHPKIEQFLNRISSYMPGIKSQHMAITSCNSFPHSSGIASSASAMAALALCLLDWEKRLNLELSDDLFKTKASFLARLGSGSAARSIEGPFTVWGENTIFENSTDLFAQPLTSKVHTVFQSFQDTILIIDRGTKKVSSSHGHQLMNGHPFAENRFLQANDNCELLSEILSSGDLDDFIEIVESEALTLHSMMMTSSPRFILMQPNTLIVINKIWDFRAATQLPLCFTLDAGANVHLLYPEAHIPTIKIFIQEELSQYCEAGRFIEDQVGQGAKKL